MNKKRSFLIALILAFCMMLAFSGCKGNKSKKPDDIEFSVASVEATTGSIVKVPVKVTKNPGFMACELNFEYDEKVLQYVSFEKGSLFSDILDSQSGGNIKLSIIGDGDVKDEGEIVFLKFKVIGEEKKDTEVKLNLKEDSICNYDEILLSGKAENGVVTIK